MSPVVCRLLPYAVADGPHNMAADEVLLESAAAGVASLRFYGWSEPTVSLGYFQPERLRREDERLAGLPYVRRPSGGAALVHHHELTYALCLPAGPPWQPAESWFCRMHGILAAALAGLGVDARPCGCSDESRFTGTLCFQHLTAGDLLIAGSKVVGSAQRRQRGALMQHGGILLARSPYAPVLPGIREQSGREVAIPELIVAAGEALARRTGWTLEAGYWTECEGRRQEELVVTKYAQPAWNRKR